MTIDLLCNLLALVCLVVLSCLWIWGVHGAFSIMEFSDRFWRQFPDVINKPLVGCPPCMSTVHVPLVFFVTGAYVHLPWFYLLLTWIMTAGLNFVIKEYLYPEQE